MTGDKQGNGTEQSGKLLPEFNGLKEIDEARDVRVRGKSSLEILLSAGREISSRFPTYMLNHFYDHDRIGELLIYRNNLRRKLSALPSFNEQDLKDFVFANIGLDFTRTQQIALGIVSGCLIDILTERNKARGERTRIYINGQGKRFDYLFLFANADELIIHNFNGNFICNYIGSAHRVAALGINGQWMLEYPASSFEKSKIDVIVCAGVRNYGPLVTYDPKYYGNWFGVGKIINVGYICRDELLQSHQRRTLVFNHQPTASILEELSEQVLNNKSPRFTSDFTPDKITNAHRVLFGKGIFITGLTEELTSDGLFKVYQKTNDPAMPLELYVFLEQMPSQLYARLQEIFYGEDFSKERRINDGMHDQTTHTYKILPPEQFIMPEYISQLLSTKSESEIVRIVDQLSELTNVGQALSVR